MTDHEAIIYLENIGELLEYVTHEDYLPHYREALTMAIDALEKQIPQKPSYYIEKDYGIFECPFCKAMIESSSDISTWNFCMNCGQALDWSEVES